MSENDRRVGPESGRITVVPILLYHSISSNPPLRFRPFTVSPSVFCEQLDSIVALGFTALTVSQFVETMRGFAPLPNRPIVITFDDGFADFHTTAEPALRERGLRSTLYVTTGFLRGGAKHAVEREFGEQMLEWSQLAELRAEGVEIGAHSHTHPHLDILPRSKARAEITQCKAALEEQLQTIIKSFAYPNGYASPAVRRLVREAAYESACSVKNALSSTADDAFSLARLTVQATTSRAQFRTWLAGAGARVSPSGERIRTRLWRLHRRVRAVTAARPGSDS